MVVVKCGCGSTEPNCWLKAYTRLWLYTPDTLKGAEYWGRKLYLSFLKLRDLEICRRFLTAKRNRISVCFHLDSKWGSHTTERTRGILLPCAFWFRNFCYVTLSDSAVLTVMKNVHNKKRAGSEPWFQDVSILILRTHTGNKELQPRPFLKQAYMSECNNWRFPFCNMHNGKGKSRALYELLLMTVFK